MKTQGHVNIHLLHPDIAAEHKIRQGLFRPPPPRLPLLRRVDLSEANLRLAIAIDEHCDGVAVSDPYNLAAEASRRDLPRGRGGRLRLDWRADDCTFARR